MKYSVQGGTIVTPEFVIQGAAVTIQDDTIIDTEESHQDVDFVIQLQPTDLVFPGLINAHDHLLGNYYPRVGNGPYINWRPWDNDLKTAPIYQERGLIDSSDIYLLGAYRNLLSGVTTVSDHIPHQVNENFIDQLPIRVISKYGLSHENSSYDLKWGNFTTHEHQFAKDNDLPYITHIEEGYDEESTLGIDILKELKVLDEYTVLIHGIMLSEQDIKDIAVAKAHLIWCPNSNHFMFNDTTNIKKLLEENVNVSLGTDSPMSGGVNLLEEMQFAKSLYSELYGEELDDKQLINMITVNAAKAYRLPKLGRIKKGYTADLTVIRNGDPTRPYYSLIYSWLNDVRMVIRDGIPLYGLRDDYDIFRHFEEHYQLIEINGGERILIGRPIDLYERIWRDVKFKKILPFFPVEV